VALPPRGAALTRRLLVDTDTASDDAVALLLALRTPGVEVAAVTVVAGNVPLEQAVQNALYTVELAGVPVPVHVGRGVPRALRRVVVMGGTSDAVGNQTPVAEYNVWADPEAAAVVFASGAPLVMVGWDVSRKWAVFEADEAERLRALGPLGAFAVEIQATLDGFAREESGLPGFDLPDPIAMAVALDPAVATEVRRLHVAVELDGKLTRGMTVVDHLGWGSGEPNVDVVLAADRERFLALLHGALAS